MERVEEGVKQNDEHLEYALAKVESAYGKEVAKEMAHKMKHDPYFRAMVLFNAGRHE